MGTDTKEPFTAWQAFIGLGIAGVVLGFLLVGVQSEWGWPLAMLGFFGVLVGLLLYRRA